MDETLNPYAAPATVSAPPVLPTQALFYRDGKFLRVANDAELPLLCLATGETTSAEDWRKKKPIAWTPQWVFIGIFFGLLPVLILSMVLQKRGKITYSLSRDATKKIKTRRAIGTVLLLASIGSFALLATLTSSQAGIAALLGVVFFIAALVFFIISNPIKPAGYDKGWFKMRGCSPDFLAALPDFPWANAKDIPEQRPASA